MRTVRLRKQLADTLEPIHVLLALVPWRMRHRLIAVMVAALFTSILDMVAVGAMLPLIQLITSPESPPAYIQAYLVPLFGTSDPQRLLLRLAAATAGLFLLKNLILIALRWWTLGEMTRASAAAQAELLTRYVGAPYVRHRLRPTSRILYTVSAAVSQAFSSVVLGSVTVVVDGLTVIAIFITLAVMTPTASLLGIVIFGGAGLLIEQSLKRRTVRVGRRLVQLGTESWQLLNPAIAGFRETRLFSREALFSERYADNRRAEADVSRARTMLSELPKYLLEIVMVFGILVIGVVLFMLHDRSTAFGLLAAFAAGAVRVIPAVNRIVATANQIRAGVPALMQVVDEVRELGRDVADDCSMHALDVTIPPADIEVRDLGFRYPDAHANVLSGVTVTIPYGHTVALVGGSGAGKTTFADIIAGLLPATEGSITVGGVDILTHARSWRSTLAMVSQGVYLWDAPVRDLITFGEPREEVDDSLLDDVVRRARLTGFIRDLPDGLDTLVGENGTRVSGGQAQRIGIARALYSQPRVLILDEATSALDNETERQVTETIEALHGQMTVLVIAHRLSTVRNADSILFFKGGRIAGHGTMRELYESDSDFANLVDLGRLDH
ncbi:MAG: ABC transporter ATP-binding protein [Bowdeniella nasicola]|nr:ABC transporter ATP-binding protein [Bowdeniella nasicola]